MSVVNVVDVRVNEARGAVFDDHCQPFLRIRQRLPQQMARKICEKQVSRIERLVIGLESVVDTLEAYEYRGAYLCLIGAAVYENSSTRLELQETRGNNRGIRPHGVVLKGTDELHCPRLNSRSG